MLAATKFGMARTEQARSPRFDVFLWFPFVDVTRVRRTRPGVVSFSILSRFPRRRTSERLSAPNRGGSTARRLW